jgi:hypothetical protein
VGGGLAAVILYLIITHGVKLFSGELAAFVRMDMVFYAGVVAAGAALGLVGGLISVFQFIRPGNSR